MSASSPSRTWHTSSVAEVRTTTHARPPARTSMVSADVSGGNPVPVSVRCVPPARLPEAGVTKAISGCSWKWKRAPDESCCTSDAATRAAPSPLRADAAIWTSSSSEPISAASSSPPLVVAASWRRSTWRQTPESVCRVLGL
eukprot:1182448-Prorocentrum_minimum.AAC.25